MKLHFPGYYNPVDTELDAIWDSGMVVLDTNALLNLFRYTPNTREDFITVLEAVSGQLWLPHQVASEFQRHRISVIDQQAEAYTEVEGALVGAQSTVGKVLQKFKRHPSLDVTSFDDELHIKLKELNQLLAESKRVHEESILNEGSFEATFAKITELYDGRVGDPFSAEVFKSVCEEGQDRYELKIPPGYKDIDKPEPERYGDLILWKQMLDESATNPRPAIFVTDDAKEDWWYKVNGKTQGARVELVDEYYRASGHRIHFYTPERFLAFAKKRGNSDVRDESLSEVQEVSSQRATRAIEQLETRRAELLAEKDRLFGRLHQITDGPSERNFTQRRLREAQRKLEVYEHQLYDNTSMQETLRQRLEEQGMDPEGRDPLIFELGQLKARENVMRKELEEGAASLDHLVRMTGRGPSRLMVEQTRERIMRLDSQLEEVGLALSELDLGD